VSRRILSRGVFIPSPDKSLSDCKTLTVLTRRPIGWKPHSEGVKKKGAEPFGPALFYSSLKSNPLTRSDYLGIADTIADIDSRISRVVLKYRW
jgi:hypothetical protein